MIKCVFVVTLLLLISCSPGYVSNPLIAPQFEKSGQYKLSASIGSNDLNVQAAHSLTNHFAIIGTAGFISRKSVNFELFSDNYFTEGTSADIGMGYFHQTHSGRYINELYIGLGGGDNRMYNLEKDNYREEWEYWKSYLQYNFGIKYPNWNIICSSRSSYFKFKDGYPKGNGPNLNRTTFLIEPGITVKQGQGTIRLVYQLLGSIATSKKFGKRNNEIAGYLGIEKSFGN